VVEPLVEERQGLVIEEVGVDLLEPWPLGWVNAKEGASDTGFSELTV